jgi:beta-glucanase (GH16 family)
MKKIAILTLIIVMTLTLMGCKYEVPNGLQPLVSYEECLEPTLEDGYVCVWADEFNGNTLDLTKWNIEENGSGGGNQELQFYRKENLQVKDGQLTIEAKKEYDQGKNYTSGRMNSKYKGEWKYAKVIVAAQVPEGKGTWSAIWMLPTMNAYGIWPNSGEIDIMEHVGYDPNRIFSSTHTKKFNHQNSRGALTFSKTLFEATKQLQVYELTWVPGKLIMRVNGDKIGEFNYTPAFNQDVNYQDVFPFDQNMHLILNLAIGGNWGGAKGVNNDIFPASMIVDYVRVYQQDYAKTDLLEPLAPTKIKQMKDLKQSLYWTPSQDDQGIETYAVYVDGKFNKYTSLNQISLSNLAKGNTYEITIEAIDFVGRVSPKSEPFNLEL